MPNTSVPITTATLAQSPTARISRRASTRELTHPGSVAGYLVQTSKGFKLVAEKEFSDAVLQDLPKDLLDKALDGSLFA